ncbi:MAG: hypothetical protein ACREQY_00330, partial [Candidatus Binatia bacterium]
HEILAAVRVGAADGAGVRLIVRLPAVPDLAPGAPVGLRIDPAEFYLFGEDGLSLSAPPP